MTADRLTRTGLIPSDWDDLVRSLLHKEPRRRYGDAAALARILRRLDTAFESGGSANSSGFPPPTEPDLSAAPAPGEFLFATSLGDSGTVRLWDPATGRAVGAPLTGHTNVTWEASFSADGSLVAANSEDNTTLVWDTATGRLAGPPFTAPADGGMTVAGSADGPLAVEISEEGTVRFRDAATRESSARTGDPRDGARGSLTRGSGAKRV